MLGKFLCLFHCWRKSYRPIAFAGLLLTVLTTTSAGAGEPVKAQEQVQSQNRIALVIGNGAYKNVEHLANPINDAQDTAEALQRIGFAVTRAEDLDFIGFRNAVLAFKKAAETADMAIIYFAGHGVEIDGENWLLPIDVELRNDVDASSEAIGLRWAMHAVENTKTLGIVILDSCRNNPFKIAKARTRATRAAEIGLAPVDTTDNVLVVYASRHGTVAFDGDGRNSPFTASLLRHVETPGLEVDFLFRNVRDDVIAATEKMQQPVVYGSLSSDEIYLVPPTDEQPVASSEPQDAVEVAWSFLQESDDVSSLIEFNDRFKGNRYSADARKRIAWLQSNPGGRDSRNPTADVKLASAEIEPVTEEKITARRFRRDTPAVKEAWDVVRSTKDQKIIRKFVDQFPSRERRVTANKRLADLGQQPVAFNVQPLPAATGETPDQIQQFLIGRASDDPDVLSCLGSAGQTACGRALVKYPALGEYLKKDSFVTNVCQSLSRPLGECNGFIATNPTLVSMRPGVNNASGQSAAGGGQNSATAGPVTGAGPNAPSGGAAAGSATASGGTAVSDPVISQSSTMRPASVDPGASGPTKGGGAEVALEAKPRGNGGGKGLATGNSSATTTSTQGGTTVLGRTDAGGGSARRPGVIAPAAGSRIHSTTATRVVLPATGRISPGYGGGGGASAAARAAAGGASSAAGRAATAAAGSAANRAATTAAGNAAGRAASAAASNAAGRAAATAASNAASAAAGRAAAAAASRVRVLER